MMVIRLTPDVPGQRRRCGSCEGLAPRQRRQVSAAVGTAVAARRCRCGLPAAPSRAGVGEGACGHRNASSAILGKVAIGATWVERAVHSMTEFQPLRRRGPKQGLTYCCGEIILIETGCIARHKSAGLTSVGTRGGQMPYTVSAMITPAVKLLVRGTERFNP